MGEGKLKLDFEKYIDMVVKSKDARELYNESIVCYKAGAYRASYLMSYLGFMESVRYKIMNSNKPETYSPERWERDVSHKISSEEIWDKNVFEILIRTKDPIFNISEGLRTQLFYWKDRRNDCAHFKENEISYSHIEAFWLFIRSNFEKLSVNGNVEDLWNKFKVHFDNSKTIPGTSYDHLIDECIRILDKKSTKNFVEKIFENFKINDYFNVSKMDVEEIIYKILIQNDNVINDEIVSWIKSNEKNFKFKIIKEYPKLLDYFDLDESEIRYFWYEKLDARYEKELDIICYLINRGSIREEEKTELLLKLLTNCYSEISKDNFECLKQYGFFEFFGANAFGKISNFDWANSHRDIILFYIETFGLQEIVVKNICLEFNQSQHAWHLRDALNEFFKKNTTKKEEFIEIARENYFSLPNEIECFREEV